MKLSHLATVFFFFRSVSAVDYEIRDIEQCSSSGKSSTILKCKSDEARKTVILALNITKIVDKMNVSLIVEKLVLRRFQQLFKFPDIDWCKFMSKGLKPSAVIKIIIDAIKSSSSGVSGILHKCPYFGLHAANISVSTDVIRIVPPGVYRLKYVDSIEDDVNFLTFTGVFQVGDVDD